VADQPQEVKVGEIRFPDYLRPTYTNFIQVNHTPWDFRLVGAVVRTPTPGEETASVLEAGGVIHPEAVVDLIIPANLIHGLISAFKESFERYIEAYGAPGLSPEGPRPPEDG